MPSRSSSLTSRRSTNTTSSRPSRACASSSPMVLIRAFASSTSCWKPFLSAITASVSPSSYDGRADCLGDEIEDLQHALGVVAAELDQRVTDAETRVLAELIDHGLLPLAEQRVAQSKAQRDLDRLPRPARRLRRGA